MGAMERVAWERAIGGIEGACRRPGCASPALLEKASGEAGRGRVEYYCPEHAPVEATPLALDDDGG